MGAPTYNYHGPKYSEFQEYRSRKTKWKGIWITHQIQSVNHKTNKAETHHIYQCSICSSKFTGDALFPTNFCPNCGADMREEKE